MNNLKPLVLVPIHKKEPTQEESISLRQCGKVFSLRDIAILCPRSLPLDKYSEFFPSAQRISVDDFWMSSIKAYNKLMYSPFLWTSLSNYTHVLIHEPDAIALNDDLDYWCNINYDYIGAPWLEGWENPKVDAKIIGVGNFGFSLHRIDFYRSFFASKISHGWFNFDANCDLYWCYEVPKHYPINLASYDEAVRFAWEAAPRRCYELAGGIAPFGIHAWAKYDPQFVLPFLQNHSKK